MEDRILNYINDEGSHDERKQTLQWIMADQERIATYKKLMKVYSLTGSSDYIADDKIQNLYNQLNIGKKQSIGQNKITIAFMRYAAIIIVALTTGWFAKDVAKDILRSEQTEKHTYIYQTREANTQKITLPDGTLVWLNSNSTLAYTENFGKHKSRNIKLSGEGYFDVFSDKNRPFKVNVGEIDVKVIGTEFNINAIDSTRIVTTLVEGKVVVNDNNGKQLTSLLPNQQAIYNINKKNIECVDINNTGIYASWKEGYIQFDNTPFMYMQQQLENSFNIELKFNSEHAKNVKITGKAYTGKPIEELIYVLEKAYDLNITTTKSNTGKLVLMIN